eukprot:scaffold360_cov374-Pavlova_lutheri.AAC.51
MEEGRVREGKPGSDRTRKGPGLKPRGSRSETEGIRRGSNEDRTGEFLLRCRVVAGLGRVAFEASTARPTRLDLSRGPLSLPWIVLGRRPTRTTSILKLHVWMAPSRTFPSTR